MHNYSTSGRFRQPSGAAAWLAIVGALWIAALPVTLVHAASPDAPVKERNIGVSRERSNKQPRSEGDQTLVDGWPLYRSERGQTAFNDAMATLKATESAAPAAKAFAACGNLECNLALPLIGSDGWIPAGRIWVSPAEYVLFAHSPRLRSGQHYRRRMPMSMRYFVFHEFHNSSRNTDPYDTISSHSGSVFVPFYMSKQGTDAQGRRFVVVVQVAPHDVFSVHASNMGSSGPGIEVAKNVSDGLEPLQGVAGILVATMIKHAAPHLQVVNHRGTEGRPMLSAYERRLAAVRSRPGATTVTLPFMPAPAQRVAAVASALDDLILRRGASPRLTLAERALVPLKPAPVPTSTPAPPMATASTPAMSATPRPSPLAQYLATNLAAMKRQPRFAPLIPSETVGVIEESPDDGIVYLLDAERRVLGHIEPHLIDNTVAAGQYAYFDFNGPNERVSPVALNLSQPVTLQTAEPPQLIGPIRLATRPMPKPTKTISN